MDTFGKALLGLSLGEENQKATLLFLDFESLACKSNVKSNEMDAEITFSRNGFSLNSFQTVGARPIQLACIKCELGQNTKEELLLDIEMEFPENYYTEEAVKWAREKGLWKSEKAVPIPTALGAFASFLPNEGKVYLVAYNAPFDLTLLPLWFARANKDKGNSFFMLPKCLEYFSFDALADLREKFPERPRGRGMFTLSKLYEDITGKKLENAHFADADTRAMFELLSHVYGDDKKMMQHIVATAKPWRADFTQSLFGVWMKGIKGRKNSFLKKESIKTLESAGWTTAASITQNYVQKKGLVDLPKLQGGEIFILQSYCEWKTRDLEKIPLFRASKRVFGLSDRFLADDGLGLLSVQVDGCSGSFVMEYTLTKGVSPTVGHLVNMAERAKTFANFAEVMKSYGRFNNESKEMWTWLMRE
jgi:hypothetical protein